MENGSLASLLLHVHGHSARSIVFNLAGAVSWPGFEDSHVTEITYAQPCVFAYDVTDFWNSILIYFILLKLLNIHFCFIKKGW